MKSVFRRLCGTAGWNALAMLLVMTMALKLVLVVDILVEWEKIHFSCSEVPGAAPR